MITTGKGAHLPGSEHLHKRRDAGEVVGVDVNVQLNLHLQRRGTDTSKSGRVGTEEGRQETAKKPGSCGRAARSMQQQGCEPGCDARLA
eukprot:scaffold152206_cov17-Tisochrysis_lutea.AAC.1